MEICGRLISVNAYGDWGRGMLEIGSGEKVPVVGRGLAGLEEAELYRFRGEYVEHPKYGRQFDVADALVDAPSEAAGVVKGMPDEGCAVADMTLLAILLSDGGVGDYWDAPRHGKCDAPPTTQPNAVRTAGAHTLYRFP